MLSLQEGVGRVVFRAEQLPGGRGRDVQGPEHLTTTPHLATTPHHNYNHKNFLPRIMWTDYRKKSPYFCLFLCLYFLFIELNEMSPMVSFLVGYVRNYFQKFVCIQILNDQSMTFSGNRSPGVWEQLHQKLELRNASGLDSWEA